MTTPHMLAYADKDVPVRCQRTMTDHLVTDWHLQLVKGYFRLRGVDPDTITLEFFLYHLGRGLGAAELLAIATNTHYPAPSVRTEAQVG